MRLSQDASHHIFAFQPELRNKQRRQMSVKLRFFATKNLRWWFRYGDRNIHETVCDPQISTNQLPNKPTNQLINLQISTLEFIQGFIGMRTSSAQNFFPTCQVRVVRFYVSRVLLLLLLLLLRVLLRHQLR